MGLRRENNTKRREVLLGLTLSIPFITGCLSDNSTVPGVSYIEVYNYSESDITADLMVEKDGDIVYEETKDIYREPFSIENEQWLGAKTNYKLTMSVSEGETKTTSSTKLSELFDIPDGSCYGIIFHVNHDESVDVYVTDKKC